MSDRSGSEQRFSQRLIAVIRDIRDKIVKGVFVNEDQVSKGVVLRLLRELGWDVFDPALVKSEHPIGGRRVDYALMREPFGAVVFIEVKRVGRLRAKGEEQLFDYCAKQGVPLAVLTDGKEWRFYFPGGMGTYEQRRFATVNLVKHDAADCARRLGRYLECRAVASGRAQSNVNTDYETHWKRIVVRKEFGPVLDSLVKEADPRFVALFRDEVERRCQIRPDEEVVREFLTVGEPASGPGDEGPPERPSGDGNYWFILCGETHRFESRRDLFLGVFLRLAERDSGFLARAAVKIGGDVRPYLSRDRSEVMKGRTWRLPPAELPGGWWIRSQFNRDSMERILPRAAEAAGCVWGEGLVVHFADCSPVDP